MFNKRVKRIAVSLGMSLAIVSLATGCGKLKKPQETETETETETATELVTESESETEKITETELKTNMEYMSQDRSIRITLPDSTWKVTQDADEMRVFSSGSAAMINIVHASNEAQMRKLSVFESEEALKESLTKQYPSANAFEVVDFTTASAGTLKTYEYVVKYNTTSMWAYAITYGIVTDKEAYVVNGTVTDDNKMLLSAVQKSMESFTVLRNSVFSAVQGGKLQNQSETQQSESNQGADAELKTLTDYGTTATLYAADNVNVRLQPSTESSDNIFGSLNKGDQVTVVGETSQWFKVNINGNIGYISKAFLVSNKPSDTGESETNAPVADSTKVTAELNSQISYGSSMTLYTTTEVNVRTEPGTDGGLVDVLGGGSELKVIGETDNWFIVSVNGSKGYVSKSYVSASGDAGTGGGTTNTGNENTDNGDGSGESNFGTISGTVTSASMSAIVIAGDDGNTYTINTTDASVDTTDGLYEGLYISATIDYSNTTPSGALYATSVSGH